VRLPISCETDRSAHRSLIDRFETALTDIKGRLTTPYGGTYELTVASDDPIVAVTIVLPCEAAGRGACDPRAQSR
jgi:hypothetical protein